jgi:DNA repair protein RadA/Sms
VVSETTTTEIFNHINRINPDVIIIDSVQTLYMPEIGSAPGSVSQVRECTAVFQRFAKQKAIPVFLVGHITKDGSLAGPKVMEHMVDTVLQFEGDRHHVYRILRAQKNRFGPASELGIYEMKSDGLAEVENPSSVLLSHRDENISGVAVSSSIEGLRPMMIEVQALVSTAAYGVPQRSATGFDLRRMNMLLAVLEKRCGFRISVKDVFLNIAGGLRVDDPAIDMSVVTAVLSSSEDIPVSMKYCFAGEIGLSGEIRPVSRIEQRVEEARKLGFDTIFISGYNSVQSKGIKGIRVAPVRKVNELFAALFG